MLAILVLALAGLLGSAIRPVWTIDPDASQYLSLGRSLAAGEGYALDGVPHTKYPPGLPLLLGGLVVVGGPEAYGLFHAALVAALLAAVLLSHALVRRLGYPPPVALAVALAVGLSQTLFDLSVVYLRTEVLFLALSLGALLTTWRALGKDGRWPTLLLAAVLILAATSVRLAGVTLLAVPGLVMLRRGIGGGARVRALLLVVVGLGVVFAWQARTASVLERFPGVPDYGAEFNAAEPRDLAKVMRLDMPPLDAHFLAKRVTGNLDVLARAMAVLLTNADRAGARLPVGALFLALVLAGLHRLWWRPGEASERRTASGYVLAAFVLYLLWPFNQQERFYVPLLPLLLIAGGEGLLLGLEWARRLMAHPAGRMALVAGGLAVVVVLALQRSDHPTLLGRYSNAYAGLLVFATVAWLLGARFVLKGHLPDPSVQWVWLLPLVFLLPLGKKRFVEWPARQDAFAAHRAEHPETGPLARIDVDRRLERVAVFLRDEMPADTLVMTDVPRMMQVMSGRRCTPFVYRLRPPAVLHDQADVVFYTRELAEAAAVMDAMEARYEAVLELDPVFDGVREVIPTVYRPR
ncbi:MAG: hypothetical protein ACYTCU_05900 [Planctomycetota bacterium]